MVLKKAKSIIFITFLMLISAHQLLSFSVPNNFKTLYEYNFIIGSFVAQIYDHGNYAYRLSCKVETVTFSTDKIFQWFVSNISHCKNLSLCLGEEGSFLMILTPYVQAASKAMIALTEEIKNSNKKELLVSNS